MKFCWSVLVFLFLYKPVNAQDSTEHSFLPSKINFFGTVQAWARSLEYNSGSVVNNQEIETAIDFSLRRYRFGVNGLLNKKVYYYFQIGGNNLNQASDPKETISLLDAYGEFRFNNKIHVGVGKSLWRGLSRYSSPSTSRLLTLDLPLPVIPTVNQTDHLLRRLGVHFKGRLFERLDYRLMAQSEFAKESTPKVGVSSFSYYAGSLNYNGYFKWSFFDKESFNTPYHRATYLGDKKLLMLGAGFEFKHKGMSYLTAVDSSLVYEDMLKIAVDVFYEESLKKGRAGVVTLYAAYFNYSFGKDFVRMLNTNNPAHDVNANTTLNGSGNLFPSVGTGQTIYTQLGYLLPKDKGFVSNLQPYVSLQHSEFEALDENILVYEGGLNWYINDYKTKLTLGYQNRPIFNLVNSEKVVVDRMSQWVVQFQFRFD